MLVHRILNRTKRRLLSDGAEAEKFGDYSLLISILPATDRSVSETAPV